jgi:hypothetical protein
LEDCHKGLDFGGEVCNDSRTVKEEAMNNQLFWVAQTNPDGTNEVLWQCTSYDQAQDEVDRINSNLAAYGIPSSVSCAYVID